MARYSISDGTSLKPIVSSMMAISPRKIRLTRLRPDCRPGSAAQRSVKAPNSSPLPKVHPNKERSTDDVPVRHKAPEAAVLAVIPIVAHHEVAFRGYRARNAARTVDASIPVCMLRCGMNRGAASLIKDRSVFNRTQRFDVLQVVLDPARIEIGFHFPHWNQRTVDRQPTVVIVDPVTWQANYPLNVILARLVGVAKHDHVAALRVSELQ